jgi:hypothetical protein
MSLLSLINYEFGPDEPLPFVHIRQLGQGAYGVVDEVWALDPRGKKSRETYARKSIQISRDLPMEDIHNEVAILQKLRHKHIVVYRLWISSIWRD